jgi:hypothetical protein
MPEVFRVGSLVFFFYSNEGQEPRHVHVRRGSGSADATGKWWLEPVVMAYADGFNVRERTRIESIILERQQELLDAWNKHSGQS